MSTPPTLTPPNADSRSSSPGQAGEPKPRAVSGSLKDRIARFNNPSAAPLVPTHPFGLAGPPSANTSGPTSRGLVGNRIPSLDPKTAGMVGGLRKVSENKGLIGNRIPSGIPPAARASSGRSASPAGSVDSSNASGAPGSSNSPITSRSSSPPTSPGLGQGFPQAFLSATLPQDNGGPGAMTPSSTRAEAGEDTSELSVPSTPVQNPALTTSAHYDLSTPNLKLASAANPALAALQGQALAPNTQSIIGSSRASNYDPGSQSSETQMMKDVSGISTPTSTPKAEHKDLPEGSIRGGSVRGEGSVVGDEDDPSSEIQAKLTGLNVEVPDRDPTPEPPKDVDEKMDAEPATDVEAGFTGATQKERPVETREFYVSANKDEADLTGQVETPEPARGDRKVDQELVDDTAGPEADEDPNQASDLADLKAGNLSRGPQPIGEHSAGINPVNSIAESGLAQGFDEQVVRPEDKKEQGGVAGQHMEDIEQPTAIESPKEQESEGGDNDAAASDDLDIHTATSPTRASTTKKNATAGADPMPDIIEGEAAAGVRLEDAEKAGAGPMTSGETDKLKEVLVERRMEVADRDGMDPSQKESLQTDEDRDEGTSRREQLILALDQNKDVGENLQGDADEQTRKKAREVTGGMTNEQRPDGKDEEAREQKIEQDIRQDQDEKKEHQKEISVGVESEGQKEERQKVEKAEGNHDDEAEPEAESTEKEPAAEVDEQFGQDAPPSSDKPDVSLKAIDDSASKKPMQVQIEPAPIAQSAETPEPEQRSSTAREPSTDDDDTPTTPASPPAFPTPPTNDPAPSSIPDPRSAASTPIDPTFLKSFPDVPDEDKPRVEVHVSHSPVSSPLKNTAGGPETPLAKIPGRSQSLQNPGFEKYNDDEVSDMRRDSLDVDATPTASHAQRQSAEAKAARRVSTRRSPKSPLLDDEDPGDFEPGEGWAVVTKGRDT